MDSLPSPASSPSLEPTDSSPQPSRKRQRSRSMQSDASSSSAKRSVSDGAPLDPVVRIPSSDQMSTLTLADPSQDIDSYMASQGEADIPPFIALTPPQDSSLHNMSAAEKLSFVDKGKAKKMEAKETWYLVSRRWYKRWRNACSGEVDKEGPVSEQDLGPVDNSPLLDAAGALNTDITEGIEVEYVPDEIWNAFITWYGPSQHPLGRHVTTRGVFSKTTFLELRPLQLKVFRLVNDAPTNLAIGPPHPTVEASIGDTVKDLCAKVADAVKSDATVTTPYRVWKLDNDEDWRTLEFPTEKLKDVRADIVEESAATLEDNGVETGDAYVVEFKLSSGWLVDPALLQKSPLAIEGPPPLFNSKDGFFNRFGSSSSSIPTAKTSTDFYSGFGSSKGTSSFSTGKSYNKPLEPGALGLGNMGNTCFMNSALQCLAHTQELTEYFLSGVFKDELNRDNPLGMHGAIAEIFGSLLERIWATSGPSSSYSPREFKQQLQRFAPQFSGYQQHDSQELVAFLLDGLHEDLNRVIKKPYVEKPDWEGGRDLELVKLATDSWNGYMLRNDSVIVDLFQGQYQSTLVCPECSKVSITFDPFMYLTLPLPVNRKWKHTIFYIPWDLEKPHLKVPIEISRDVTFKELRVLLGRWMGAVPENLLTLEIFQHRFYKNLDDTIAVTDMNDTDTIVCFELPCNARQSRNYKKSPDDPFIVPLFLTDVKPPAVARPMYGMSRTSPSYFGYPTVIVIDKEEAKSVEAMYDAAVSRLQRWTTHARDLYNWEVPSSDESITEIPGPLASYPSMESVTEITPEGDIREVQQPVEENDITEEKTMVVDSVDDDDDSAAPRPVRTKKDIFELRLQPSMKDYGSSYNTFNQNKWETWDNRKAQMEKLKQQEQPVLLKEADAFFCEFDENMKAYFFGETSKYELSRWDEWTEFIHPEYAEAKKAGNQSQRKGLSLEDCLEEFVREEQLGEDDLWYCPQCKKHQQATKKFDLWKAPDILVVHLKRFSNNRILRDKIDTFVDFPVKGLDLGDKVGERAVAKRLLAEGIDLEELQSVNLDEPLLYDLFAVDEHMGGLGGGHYRAYSSNHLNDKWYHFDDAYVTPAKPEDSVTSNAYLLFYRRRSSDPLGGKTYQKVMEHKAAPSPEDLTLDDTTAVDGQLPTPPNELTNGRFGSNAGISSQWNLRSSGSVPGSLIASPTADDAPGFEEGQSDQLVSDSYDTIFPYAHSYTLPDHFRKSSPTSSNEAEVDPDYDRSDIWDPNYTSSFSVNVDFTREDEWDIGSNQGSPSYSEAEASAGSPLEDDLYGGDLDDPARNVDVVDDTDETKTT